MQCSSILSADKYNGSCKVSTWLCQIAKHLWYQELDRRKRKGTSQLDENLVSPKAALEEELCIKEEKMELFRKVHVLEETAKEVVLLRCIIIWPILDAVFYSSYLLTQGAVYAVIH